MAEEKLSRQATYLLYRLSQHKHGWLYLLPSDKDAARELADADLAYFGRGSEAKLIVGGVGRLRIQDRWPICPLLLETYEPPLGGWTPFEPKDDPHA